jgi:hypothetical protein
VDIKVWEKATNMVDGHMLLNTPAPVHTLPDLPLKKATPILDGDDTGLPAKPVKVKKATPTKPKPAAKAAPAVKKAAPKTPVTKEPKMTQQEQMAKLVEYYNKNPDKQNAKEIVAYKQKTKKSWDVLGVTDTKFIKKITERAKL